MNRIEQLIESNDIRRIKEYIDSTRYSDLSTNEWLGIAQKLSAVAFSEEFVKLEYAELAVATYEKMDGFEEKTQSMLFSALYLRLRVNREIQNDNRSNFFSNDIILDAIRRNLSTPNAEIQLAASNWRSQGIEKIKELRSYKMWIKLLMEFETTTNHEYAEFEGWKSLYPLLP